MTSAELIERIRARGGELRVAGDRLQYRPLGIVSAVELDWLARHRAEVELALLAPDVGGGGRPLGEAGAGVPAWHCRIDLGSGHARGTRADGSSFCATCHPSAPSPRGSP